MRIVEKRIPRKKMRKLPVLLTAYKYLNFVLPLARFNSRLTNRLSRFNETLSRGDKRARALSPIIL